MQNNNKIGLTTARVANILYKEMRWANKRPHLHASSIFITSHSIDLVHYENMFHRIRLHSCRKEKQGATYIKV